jgi:homoserine kinase
MDSIISFAPATIANVGPCYDIMGYALDYAGDFAEASKLEGFREDVVWGGVTGPRAKNLQTLPAQKNAAWVVADDIWKKISRQNRCDYGLRLVLHKYMEAGTGLGSSSCSGVAAARAVLSITGARLSNQEIADSLILGEETSCGVGHPDNVIPSFFGGFFFMTLFPYDSLPGGESRFYQVSGGESLVSVVVKPRVTVKTRKSRHAVARYVQKRYSAVGSDPAGFINLIREQSAKAADMILAFQQNDIERLGAIMRNNELLETPRSEFIPFFHEVKQAALKAGAYGCSIAGSGPSIVAVTGDREAAESIRLAMQKAFGDIPTRWLISPVNKSGAVVVDSVQDFVARSTPHTDMMTP